MVVVLYRINYPKTYKKQSPYEKILLQQTT